MGTVDYAAIQAAAQAEIDEYMEAYYANGRDPSKTPLEIPKQLWDAQSWSFRAGPLKTDVRARIVVQVPADEYFDDPRDFQAYPVKAYDDFIYIGAGVPDPSGGYMAKYNLSWDWVNADGEIRPAGSAGRWHRENPDATYQLVQKPCINIFDIRNDFIHDSPDAEAIEYLRTIDMNKAALTSDPATWPDAFRVPFEEGHPDYVYPGPANIDPKPYVA